MLNSLQPNIQDYKQISLALERGYHLANVEIIHKQIFLFIVLKCAQVREELLKVGVLAQQFPAGFNQPVHLFVA